MKFATAGTLGSVIYLQTLLVNGRPILFAAEGFAPPDHTLSRNADPHHFQYRTGQSTFQNKANVMAPSSVVINHSEKVQAETSSGLDGDNAQVTIERRSPLPARIDAKELRVLSAATEGGAPSWMHVDRRLAEEESGALVRRGVTARAQAGAIRGPRPVLPQKGELKGTGMFVPKYKEAPPHFKSFKEYADHRPSVDHVDIKPTWKIKPSMSEKQIGERNAQQIGKHLDGVLKQDPNLPWSRSQSHPKREESDYIIKKAPLLVKRNEPLKGEGKGGTGYYTAQYHLLKKPSTESKTQTKEAGPSADVEELSRHLFRSLSYKESKPNGNRQDVLSPWKPAEKDPLQPWNVEQRQVNEQEDFSMQLVRRDNVVKAKTVDGLMMMKRAPPGEPLNSKPPKPRGPRRGTMTGSNSPALMRSASASSALPRHHVPVVPYQAYYTVQPIHAWQYPTGHVLLEHAHPIQVPYQYAPVFGHSEHDLTRSYSAPHPQPQPHYHLPNHFNRHESHHTASLPSNDEVQAVVNGVESHSPPLSQVFTPLHPTDGAGMFYTD